MSGVTEQAIQAAWNVLSDMDVIMPKRVTRLDVANAILAAVTPLIAAAERERAATLLERAAALSSNPHDVDAWREAAAAIRRLEALNV